MTFDENFAKATGVRVGAYNVVIAVLTAVTIVLGMRMMGAMLISSLVIFPCLTSMRAFKSFGGVVISSGVLSVLCFLAGDGSLLPISTPAGGQHCGGEPDRVPFVYGLAGSGTAAVMTSGTGRGGGDGVS